MSGTPSGGYHAQPGGGGGDDNRTALLVAIGVVAAVLVIILVLFMAQGGGDDNSGGSGSDDSSQNASSSEDVDYDDGDRDDFVTGCLENNPQTYCDCVWTNVSAQVPYDEFTEYDDAVREASEASQPLPEMPANIASAVASCETEAPA